MAASVESGVSDLDFFSIICMMKAEDSAVTRDTKLHLEIQFTYIPERHIELYSHIELCSRVGVGWVILILTKKKKKLNPGFPESRTGPSHAKANELEYLGSAREP
jgi:hypothetical protein